MVATLFRRGLLLLAQVLLLVVCVALLVVCVALGLEPFHSGFGQQLGFSLGLVLLYVFLWRWLAAPSREWLAARLPWVLWLWLPVPLTVLAFAPWVLDIVPMWLGPSTHEYALNPLVFVTFRIYLFVTSLALATGRPTVPRVLLRLAFPWALFLVALELRLTLSPRPIFLG